MTFNTIQSSVYNGIVGALRFAGGPLTAQERLALDSAFKYLAIEGKLRLLMNNSPTPAEIHEAISGTYSSSLAEVLKAFVKSSINIIMTSVTEEELKIYGGIPDLVAYADIGSRQVCLVEDKIRYLLSLPDGVELLKDVISHEMSHINHPNASEMDIEYGERTRQIRPVSTYNARLALTLRSVAEHRAILTLQNRSYFPLPSGRIEGKLLPKLLQEAEYDFIDVGNVHIAGIYYRPLPQFAKFDTGDVRWLVPGALNKLAQDHPETWSSIVSDGYTQEDFNIPNVGIMAKTIAIYNIRKALGYYPAVVGTTEEFSRRLKEKGIMISYDNRPNNLFYAKTVARVLAAYCIKSAMTRTDGLDTPVPLPAVRLMVEREGYAGSIMLTAGHYGDQWNGFKFETEDGAPAQEATNDAIGGILAEEFKIPRPNYDIAAESVEELVRQGRLGTADPARYYVKSVAVQVK